MRVRVFVIAALFALFSTCAALANALPAPPRHDFPPIGSYEVLSCDFHMHTNKSDGRLTTRERVEESYSMGYDAITLADHASYSKTYRVGKMVGEPLGLIVIPGFETGVKGKEHMLVLGVPDWFHSKDAHKWAEKPGEDTSFYKDEMKAVADAGGIMVYNHPHVGYREPVKWGIQQDIIKAIEVKNDVVGKGWNTTELRGLYCYPDAFDFALENNLALLANTDVHSNRTLASSRTLVLVSERTAKGVIDGIAAKRTVAWFDGVLWGREALLTDLLKNTVVVRQPAGGKIVVENKGPVILKGTIDGVGTAFELPAYGQVNLDVDNNGKSIKVVWTNVWINPQTNLAMSFL